MPDKQWDYESATTIEEQCQRRIAKGEAERDARFDEWIDSEWSTNGRDTPDRAQGVRKDTGENSPI